MRSRATPTQGDWRSGGGGVGSSGGCAGKSPELEGDGHEDAREGEQVLVVAHALARPAHVDIEALARALACATRHASESATWTWGDVGDQMSSHLGTHASPPLLKN